MWFDTIDSVTEFAGEDYKRAVVAEKAQKVLSHYDKESQHYEIREDGLLYK